ncbi:MAG: DUF2130 domain-containing protein [Bacteroidales bacterium]|nr:DUF2130 domain-containing protein [Bacteroidales bacterium]
MKEIKCPHCGTSFTVNDSDYEAIVSQIRTKEFNQSLEERLHEQHQMDSKNMKLYHEKIMAEKDKEYQSSLNEKNLALNQLKSEIETLKQREEEARRLALQNSELKHRDEIDKLKTVLAAKENEIERMRSNVENGKKDVEFARLEEQKKAQEELNQKSLEISSLTNRLVSEKENYEMRLKESNEMIDRLKDMKTRLSTKMVGETLEQHCSIQFDTTIRTLLPYATFEKDNEVIEGTKGDFIFRDYDNGQEYISIMFEMKNENDETASKHKNEDFLDKLDKDRKKKKCEYAVLVSMLEIDNELYNNGIVDKSHRYEKMYVIRPQFFIPLITLLVQTSRKSIELQRQLVLAKSQSVDVNNFEKELNDFKDAFGRNYRLASDKFNTAIEQIDKTIEQLNKIKENLRGSQNQLRLANDKAEAVSVKKLTKNSPSMAAAIAAASASKDKNDE